MSILSRCLLSNQNFRIDYFISSSRTASIIETPNFSPVPRVKLIPNTSLFLTTLTCERLLNPAVSESIRNRPWQIKVSNSNGFSFDDGQSRKSAFDSLLAALELTLLVSSVAVSAVYGVNCAVLRRHNLGLVDRILVWLLAGAVVVGAAIRRRQWKRICGISASSTSSSRGETGNVIERIEKLEESIRSATTIIRVLSRQLEKLGIRFRVTRKALKEPIEETAALAQKNSEATRALAAQEDILEKELGEVQKVLLAMQDQQQKQIELILAIAKGSRLFETKRASGQEEDQVRRIDISKADASKQEKSPEPHAVSGQKGMDNDRL